MADIVGTLRSVSINGVPFRAAADVNASKMVSGFENSAVVTSGDTLKKEVRRSESFQSVTLIVNEDEAELIKGFDREASLNMSVTTAADRVYRAPGFIMTDSRETEEGRMNIEMHPTAPSGWDLF